MLKYIPILGPWLCSVVEDNIASRIVDTLIANVVQVGAYLVVIVMISIAGVWLDVASVAAWVVDFVVMTYAIHGVFGIISAVRFAIDELDDAGWLLRLVGVSVMGVLQAGGIPLLGLFAFWSILALARGYLGVDLGGGFFEWIWGYVS